MSCVCDMYVAVSQINLAIFSQNCPFCSASDISSSIMPMKYFTLNSFQFDRYYLQQSILFLHVSEICSLVLTIHIYKNKLVTMQTLTALFSELNHANQHWISFLFQKNSRSSTLILSHLKDTKIKLMFNLCSISNII